MHDSYTPMGGFIPLFNQHLGEIIPGGIGSGLCGFLVYVFVAVFIAGLMIGRTPEYLGKKIEAYDVKLAALYLLAPVFVCLGFTGWAAVSDWGQAGLNNNGPHGFSEILYAFTSASANNGSAFAGLTCTPSNGDRAYNTHDGRRHPGRPVFPARADSGTGRGAGAQEAGTRERGEAFPSPAQPSRCWWRV